MRNPRKSQSKRKPSPSDNLLAKKSKPNFHNKNFCTAADKSISLLKKVFA
jgi:hypothetical protein